MEGRETPAGNMPDEPCPRCGETRRFTRVQRVDLGPGVRYEMFACAACGASFQREEAGGWVWTQTQGRPARTA